MKNRRDFLKEAGMLAFASFFLPPATAAGMKFSNPGIQLYTFRNQMMADPIGTLKVIASLGIREIETASSTKGHYYGLSPREMKKICSDLGMNLRSGHVALDSKWEQTLDEAAESGQEYLICSSLPGHGQTVDNYKRVAESFNRSGEQCKQRNIRFGYHNHNREFEKEGGQVLYDVLLSNTDADLVHMELDLGWVIAAGKDPHEYFNNFPGRFPLWHLKDMSGGRSTEFGKGKLDIAGILKNRAQSGLKYFFIEQEDYSTTPLESMKHNMKYLRDLKL